MLGGGSASGGWRISSELHSPLRSGSADMDSLKTTRNVWGSEEAFLSPPEYGGPLAASVESEESSEDCEDYTCGLAEEIAQSMLQEQEAEDEHALVKKSGPWGISAPKSAWSGSHKMSSSPSSPQSTLSGVGGYHWESGGSNKGSSGMSSPPTPQEGESMEALYEELLRVKLEDQVKLASQRHHMLSLQQQIIQRPSPSSSIAQHPRLLSPPSTNNQRLQFLTSAGSSKGRSAENGVVPNDNVLALAIDRAMMVKQGRQGRSKGGSAEVTRQVGWGGAPTGGGGGGGAFQGRRGGGSNSNSTKKRREELQQQQFSLFAGNVGGGGGGAGEAMQQGCGPMRAVFLGAPASRECGGTGVFLPRRLGSTHHQDSKRKPACSTVLLPSHIVQALNLNVEDTLPPSYHRRDLAPSSHRLRHHALQIGNLRLEPKEEISSSYFPTSHSTTLQEVAPNISLPSEWTY